MIFNGHTQASVDALDIETFDEIQVMYADGMLGNKAIYDSIAPLTAGVFNYLRQEGAPAYKQTSLFPWINAYSEHPDNDVSQADQVTNALMAFVALNMRK